MGSGVPKSGNELKGDEGGREGEIEKVGERKACKLGKDDIAGRKNWSTPVDDDKVGVHLT